MCSQCGYTRIRIKRNLKKGTTSFICRSVAMKWNGNNRGYSWEDNIKEGRIKEKIRTIKPRKPKNSNSERAKRYRRKRPNKPCIICGKTCLLVYDHDHQTGKFRAWICGSCNKMLGFARDDINTLKNAIDYLEQHNI